MSSPSHPSPGGAGTDGDEFQRRVGELVQAVPYGQTVTYGDLARKRFLLDMEEAAAAKPAKRW